MCVIFWVTLHGTDKVVLLSQLYHYLRGKRHTISTLCREVVRSQYPLSRGRALCTIQFMLTCAIPITRHVKSYSSGPAGTDPTKLTAIAKRYAFAAAALIGAGAAPPDAGALVDGISDAMDAFVEKEKYKQALEAGEDIVYLYRSIYRMIHPRVALQYLAMGLVALKAKEYAKAEQSLKKASRMLGITHGKYHPMTANAVETFSLVTQLLQ